VDVGRLLALLALVGLGAAGPAGALPSCPDAAEKLPIRVCWSPFTYPKGDDVGLTTKNVELSGRVEAVREGVGACDAVGGNGGRSSGSFVVSIAGRGGRYELTVAAEGIRPFVRVGDDVHGTLHVHYGGDSHKRAVISSFVMRKRDGELLAFMNRSPPELEVRGGPASCYQLHECGSVVHYDWELWRGITGPIARSWARIRSPRATRYLLRPGQSMLVEPAGPHDPELDVIDTGRIRHAYLLGASFRVWHGGLWQSDWFRCPDGGDTGSSILGVREMRD
jgi:hypothetical protein